MKIDPLDDIPYGSPALRRVEDALNFEPEDKVFCKPTTAISPVLWVSPGSSFGVGCNAAQVQILLIGP